MAISDCVEKTQADAGIYVAEDMRRPGSSGQLRNTDSSAAVVVLCCGTLSLPCGASGTDCPAVGEWLGLCRGITVCSCWICLMLLTEAGGHSDVTLA